MSVLKLLIVLLAFLGGLLSLLPSPLYFDIVRSPWFDFFYWTLASGWSAFLAAYAFIIHGPWSNIGSPEKNLVGYGRIRWAQRIHQFFLNFLGGIVGWIIIYLLVRTNFLHSLSGLEKLLLFAVTFLSITGYLPYILVIKGRLPGSN